MTTKKHLWQMAILSMAFGMFVYGERGGNPQRSDPCPAQPHRTVSAHGEGDSLGATLCCIPLYAEKDALAHLMA
jgi:hypothetical protein